MSFGFDDEEISESEDEEPEVIEKVESVFDWRKIFKAKETQMKREGTFKPYEAPEPRLQYIDQSGEVRISFNRDMNVIPKLEMVTEGTIIVDGVEYPVLEVEVINGFYSDPENLKFSWKVKEMTTRSIVLELNF